MFNLHADNNDDPPEVRNYRVHLMAISECSHATSHPAFTDISTVMSMGSVAMGYDTSVIGGAMALDSFRRDFGLVGVSARARDTLQGNIVSTFQAGTFFGALLTFPLAEKFGRRRAIMFAAAIFLLGGSIMVSKSVSFQ